VKRRYSLKGLKRFKEVIANGKRVYGKGMRMIVYMKPLQAEGNMNNILQSRFAIVVTKTYGNAVERNRIKRQIRSILVTLMPQMRQGFAVIIFPDTTCKAMQYNHLVVSVKQVLLKSGVLKQ